jgi:hypothetical protein
MESTAQATVRWLLQGDVYTARSGLADRDDVKMSGANVLSRFTRAFSPSSRLQMQLYYDRTNRRVPNQYQGTRDTFDVDLQQQFSVGGRQDFVRRRRRARVSRRRLRRRPRILLRAAL